MTGQKPSQGNTLQTLRTILFSSGSVFCLSPSIEANVVLSYKYKRGMDMEYNKEQIDEIQMANSLGMTEDQIIGYFTPEMTASKMAQIRIGFKRGLSEEQIMFYAKLCYSESQMRYIRYAFEEGLSFEQVEVLANPRLSYNQMSALTIYFRQGLEIEKGQFLTNTKYCTLEMDYIFFSFLDGLSIEQAGKYAIPGRILKDLENFKSLTKFK